MRKPQRRPGLRLKSCSARDSTSLRSLQFGCQLLKDLNIGSTCRHFGSPLFHSASFDSFHISHLFTMLVPWLFCFCFFPVRSDGGFDSFSSPQDLRNALLRWNNTDSKLQLISRYGPLNAWNISAIRNLSRLFQDLEDLTTTLAPGTLLE